MSYQFIHHVVHMVVYTESSLYCSLYCSSYGSSKFSFGLSCIWGQFPNKPLGAYIQRDLLHVYEAFLRFEFGGLIFGGAYIQRGLFLEFYGTCI